MEDYEQPHDDTRQQTRSMRERKPPTPTEEPAQTVTRPRVQPPQPVAAAPAPRVKETEAPRVKETAVPRVQQQTAVPRVQETAVPRVQETAIPRVQETAVPRVQDTLKSKRPRQQKEAHAPPIASRTRSQQKSGPTGPAYSMRSQMQGKTALALALAAATDCTGVDCSP